MSSKNYLKELDMDDLRKKFNAFDLDNSQKLSKNEFNVLLEQMGFSNKILNHAIYLAQDTDHDELISFNGN
jgi:hypothetical protein